ncbi:inverse autotransporter beta domain-containing protein [Stenotrophomonas sp. SORGH_AS_0321]|uniref:inverse autotransporter beta domain-containing protein n=1 Tax=Stenotrophomonas sp. SORGH_AS_0321 TaxID=3041787 RepID=UPI00286B6B65|nr:inverse autotransporter beta domain-containing protein [Stenotrophomonas sp. SORGH_AS_0321]
MSKTARHSTRNPLASAVSRWVLLGAGLALPMLGQAAPAADDGAQQQASASNHRTDLAALISQQAGAAAGTGLQHILEGFGTAEVDVQLDDAFGLRGGSIDLLRPLHDQASRMNFVQVGARRFDERNTLNIGFGQRHFLSDWMVGYNGFLDIDPDRGHQRVGVGVEAWHDNLKLSGNGYLRTSDWKVSRLVEDHEERPANGFDVRAEGYLPQYPALGARIAYEQYVGDQMDLFNRSKRSKDPRATTVGLSYTPVPMLTFSVEHKRGAGQRDNTIGLQLNVQLDKPLSQQFDASQVAARRRLAGSRYDLVERSNQIVMEYRQQQLIQLMLAAEHADLAGRVVMLDLGVHTKYAVQTVQWRDAALVAAGGRIIDMGGNKFQMQYPTYDPEGSNRYPLSVIATDIHGNVSNRASTVVKVTGVDADNVTIDVGALTVDTTRIVANRWTRQPSAPWCAMRVAIRYLV